MKIQISNVGIANRQVTFKMFFHFRKGLPLHRHLRTIAMVRGILRKERDPKFQPNREETTHNHDQVPVSQPP